MTSGSASGGDSRSVFAAGVSRGPWWVLVHQANSSLEDFEEVRKAWGGLVKKSEAGPTVAEVEKALDLGGLTPNLREMSVMDASAPPSMPSERCHKPPQKPPLGMAGLKA